MARKRRDVPWLEQRDNGVWYAFMYDAGKRRTIRESLDTKDRAEAQLKFAGILVNGFSVTRTVGASGITVAQALDHYWEEHGSRVASPARQETAIKHLKAFFGGQIFHTVDIPASRAYASARMTGAVTGRRKCTSLSTVRRELHVLVSAANHAARWKRMGPNAKPPTAMPEIELAPEVRSNRVKWLAKDVLARMFAAADPDLLAFCKIAYFTAGRRASIEKLTRAQIDLAHGQIHLDPAGATMTNKRRPTVPLYPEIRPVVERLLNESKTEYLFGQPRSFYREFVTLAADVGVEAHPHMLRHSRATHMLMDGEDPYKVARLLGDDLATVLKTYAHATVKYLETKSTISEDVA